MKYSFVDELQEDYLYWQKTDKTHTKDNYLDEW